MTQRSTAPVSSSGHGFPKRVRLLRTADYHRVYSQGRRRSLGFLVSFALANGKPFSRVGLTVSRAVGGAVERNLLRRRLREAVRRHLPELGPGWDIVFNPRLSAKSASFPRLEETVRSFFRTCAWVSEATEGDD